VLCLCLSPHFAQDGTLYAGTETNVLFRFRDGGNNWEVVGSGAISETVNAVLLSPQYPQKPKFLVLSGNSPVVSRDDTSSWSEFKSGLVLEHNPTCVIAPLGLDTGAPLLIGFAKGRVKRVD